MRFVTLQREVFLEVARFCAEARCDGETALALVLAERELLFRRAALEDACRRAQAEVQWAVEALAR